MKSSQGKFFISTAIPYVNDKPHLGFGLEIVQADVLARYRRLRGDHVFFLTGTDENALKNVLAAEERGIDVKQFIDENASEFRKLKHILNLSWDDFIRTSKQRHRDGAQKFWLACQKDIYKKKYKGLYCVGCEEFKTQKDLIDERCPEHPLQELNEVEEEDYFFRLSAYQDKIQKLLEEGKLEIIPETRRNEALSFIRRGLQDISISRSYERARGWGIPVPGDDTQVQYVWFDALTNYITALGYAENSELFQKYWQNNDSILHVIGKGVIRFHAVYWPAMLLSAGLNLPKRIFVHGYLTISGQKISKSLGNVVSPSELVDKYGADAVRYYLLREIPSGEDGDFSEAKFKERYNSDLANGLGNFAARVLKLGEDIKEINSKLGVDGEIEEHIKRIQSIVYKKIEEFKFHEALSAIWDLIGFGDECVNKTTPWAIKEANFKTQAIFNLIVILDNVAALLSPFLPATSEKITKSIEWRGDVLKVKKGEVLFPRLK